MNRRTMIIGGGAVALSSVGTACSKVVLRTPELPARVEQKEKAMHRAGMIPATFVGGVTGAWHVERLMAVTGESLPAVDRLAVVLAESPEPTPGAWALRGVTSHVKYVERQEKGPLDAASPLLGRPEATRAALIPIRKSAQWWALTQDERRAILEGRSRHIADSMKYLPRIARRLYHSRELGEPFDFLTWFEFEFAPEHTQAFDDLVGMLRSREEWTFVEREVDIRLAR